MSAKTIKLLTFGLIVFVFMLSTASGVYIPYLKAYNLVHPRHRTFTRFPINVGISKYEEIEFITSDGLKLKGWYVPPKNGAVVIFVHGLGADRLDLLNEAGFIVKQGYGALLFDLRAHGESEGKVSTMGYYEPRDVRAAVDFVQNRAGSATPLALFGHSMGAGTTLLAAAQIPAIRATIVESAFTTLEDNISDGVQALTGLPPIPFAPLIVFFSERETKVNLHAVRPIDVVAQISPRAVLFIHGAQDSVIPIRNARALYAAAKEPKQLYILPNVGHGGFLESEPKLFPQTILTFLKTYLK